MSKQLTGVIKSERRNCSEAVMCEGEGRSCQYENTVVNVPQRGRCVVESLRESTAKPFVVVFNVFKCKCANDLFCCVMGAGVNISL